MYKTSSAVIAAAPGCTAAETSALLDRSIHQVLSLLRL
jgi:hypothetical protein